MNESFDFTRQSWINLTTGIVGTKHADHTITITDADLPGWWRITLVVDSGSSTSGGFTIKLATGDIGTNYSGDGVSGFYLWGMQFEADQSFASSHIVTAGSAVTRATETLSFPFLAPPQAMTIYLSLDNWVGGAGSLFHIGSATAGTDPRLVLSIAGAGTLTATYDDGTTVATTGVLAAPSAGDDMEFLVTLTAAGVVDLAASTDGATQVDVASAAGGALPSAWAGSLLYLNSAGTSDKGFNNIGQIKIAAGILTLQEAREAL